VRTVEDEDYEYQRALQFDRRISRMPVLQHLTQILIDELEAGARDKILDVGTGTGRLGIALSSVVSGGVIVGIDPNRGMLRVAREKISERKLQNFSIVQGVAESLPFPSEVFDAACLLLSFHHFSEHERAVAEICRVLRAGGQVLSVDPVLEKPADEAEERLNRLIEKAFKFAHGPTFRFFTEAELRGLYEGAGFAVERGQVLSFPFRWRKIEEVPMGAHWLQAYELLLEDAPSLVELFERKYFTFRERFGEPVVHGEMKWVLVKAVKT